MAIRVNLNPLEAKTASSYLIRTDVYNDCDWEALYGNLRKVHRRCGILAIVLGKTGAPIKAPLVMCKAVVKTLLLYRIEIWVVTDEIMMVLEGFHHSISRRITGMTARRGDGG